LVVASALMLFLELALIRWSGSNIVHLAYFNNFVLLGSFLGIGVGFLRAARPARAARRSRGVRPPYYAVAALAALVAVVLAFPVSINRASGDVIYFTDESMTFSGPPAWLVLPLVFLATAAIMSGPAQLVGACFTALPRLEAYRLDLVGSLAGITGCTLLAFLGAPPVAWGIPVAAAYLWLLGPARRRWVALTCGLLVAMLAAEPLIPALYGKFVAGDQRAAHWSPYQKITTRHPADNPGMLAVKANGIPHQTAMSVARLTRERPRYEMPYQRVPGNPLREVLIVGAGTGNDVAIALAHGAKHVDAVEIDPRLLALGKEVHPDRPYSSPAVTTHVDDGRAFLQRTRKQYDLVLFALPDSLTLVSGASSLRLESYLFTTESLRTVRDRLAPGGAFAMYNYYRHEWLVDRLAGTAAKAFGHVPCVDQIAGGAQQAVITVARDPDLQQCGGTWDGTAATPLASDNWPFLYLRAPKIPSMYLITLMFILAISALVVWHALPRGSGLRTLRPYTDLFLLGAAFMLLETKSVTGFALLFGTTWVVNAIVFSGVLVAVLAAVEVTRRWRTPSLPVMFGVLFAGLGLAWLVPAAWLLTLPVPVRAATAVALAFLPIFAANVIFAKRFADTTDGPTAFGANLLGAVVGGCLEYAALILGYHALLVVAALLYAGALLFMWSGAARPRSAVPAAAAQ
jgi:SAM-dependent methyltransferase